MERLKHTDALESGTAWQDSEGEAQPTPTLRSLRGSKHKRLEGMLASLLAQGPTLRDIDEE